jgi:hypothetical protein
MLLFLNITMQFMENITLNKIELRIRDLDRDRLIIGIKLVCMFLFLYTAYAKIIDHDRFFKGLSKVHIISGFAVFVSWFVPISEILTFVLLLIPKMVKWGFVSFLGLMFSFTGYIVGAMIFEKALPCHCGGVIEKLSWAQHLWFNLFFIGLAALALWLLESNTKYKNHQNEKF